MRKPHLFTRAATLLALTAGLSLGAVMPAHGEVGYELASESHAYNFGAQPLAEGESFPSKFSLLDEGYVTPVKKQDPWGTCWGFAAIAASETSILSELGITYEQSVELGMPMDLSERHLAYFTYTPVGEETGAQAGEGFHVPEGQSVFMQGGFMLYATSLFSSGIGPVGESVAPYRNDEGVITYHPVTGEPYCYGDEGTWTLPEALRFTKQAYELEHSNLLPTPAVVEEEEGGSYSYTYDAAATEAWKAELSEGGAISVGFFADTSLPGQVTDNAYMNPNTWAHYTYDLQPAANHAVTVVGYDDDYPREKFAEGLAEEGTAEYEKHLPEGDGAWLVKNSWGAEGVGFPNEMDWGADLDGDGKSDGYFWLSYYDKTLQMPETFDFDTTAREASGYYLNQHDYMPAMDKAVASDADDGIVAANIFTAEATQTIRSISFETVRPGSTVGAMIFLLDEDDAVLEGRRAMFKSLGSFEHAGYHRVNIPEESQVTVAAGQRFAIAIIERGTDGQAYLNFDVAESDYSTDVAITEAVGVVNRGESVVLTGAGEQTDLVDYVQDMGLEDGMEYDNFGIKAYGEPASVEGVVPLEDAVATVSRHKEDPDTVDAVVGFDSVAHAVEYAASAQLQRHVTLKADAELTEDLEVEEQGDVTLDLNGHKLSLADDARIMVRGQLSIQNEGEADGDTRGVIEGEGSVEVLETEEETSIVSLGEGVTAKVGFNVGSGAMLGAYAGVTIDVSDDGFDGAQAIRNDGGTVYIWGAKVRARSAGGDVTAIASTDGDVRVDEGTSIEAVSGVNSAFGIYSTGGKLYILDGDVTAKSEGLAVGVWSEDTDTTMRAGSVRSSTIGMYFTTELDASTDAMKVSLEGGEVTADGEGSCALFFFNYGGVDVGNEYAMRPLEVAITGGTFEGGRHAVSNQLFPGAENASRLAVEGGTFIGGTAALQMRSGEENTYALRGGTFHSGAEEYASNADALDAGDEKTGYREVAIAKGDEDYLEGYFGYRVEAYKKGGAVDPGTDPGKDPKPDLPNPEVPDPDRGGSKGDGGKAPKGDLPKTGDPALLAVAGLAGTGAVALAAAFVGRRRRGE